jgi:hypothetical protein
MAKILIDTVEIVTPSIITFVDDLFKFYKEDFTPSTNPARAPYQGTQYVVTLEKWEGEDDIPVEETEEKQEELTEAPTKTRGRKPNGQEK